MTEQEKRELRLLGLNPEIVAEKLKKTWNPNQFIGSTALTQDPNRALIESQEAVLGTPSLTPEEEAALKQAFLMKVMSR